MENIVLVPLTKKEFRNAKNGRIINKRCQINGEECCIIISNHFIDYNRVLNLLGLGFSIYPINVSDIEWRDLDRKVKYNVIAEYNCGVSLCIISQNMYHQIQNERDEDENNNSS
jgi:hypothetical protein